MILALWHRWTQSRNTRWLVLVAALLALDVVLGSWLIAWELQTLRDMWRP